MYLYGLQAQGQNRDKALVELESTHAKVLIRGFLANLSVELVYKNKSQENLEVGYVCPVDSKAAVYHFEAKINERIIIAQCLEKEKAIEAYQNAVYKGCTAILGSQDELARDVIHLSLGNMPAGKTVKLNLKMVIELPVNTDGSITFRLPTVFNPRYCPPNQPAGPAFPSSCSFNKVFPNQTRYSLVVEGEVRGSFEIVKVSSETDIINVRIKDKDTTALISQGGKTSLNHDWSFQVYYRTVHKPQALQMTGDRSCTGLMKDDLLMLNIFPEIQMEGFSPFNEVIFVVDRSGSMTGSKMEKAKNALLLFLKSLPSGCHFNVFSFGSRDTSLFERSSERYTEKTLEKALILQKSMTANMLGTEILSVLKSVYSMNPIPGYARQVILLTDGEVWNQNDIFDLVSRHAHEARVFAVGIGDGASTALVHGISEAGRGRFEMVFHENQLQTKVMGLVASMLQENVTELKVDCEINPPQTLLPVPKIQPVIFGGQHLILYARVIPKSEVKSLKVSWKIRDMETICEIDIKDCKIIHDSNFSFHRLAAKAQLNEWEREDIERTHDQLVSLSTSSNVVSKATSFVGIDQDGENVKKEGLRNQEGCNRFQPMMFGNASLGYSNTSGFGRFNWSSNSSGIFGSSPNSSGNATQTFSSNSKTTGFGNQQFGSSSNPSGTATQPFSYNSNTTGFGNQQFGFSSNPSGNATQPSSPNSNNSGYGSQLFGSGSNTSGNVFRQPFSFSSNTFDNVQGTKQLPELDLLDIVSAQNFDGSWNLNDSVKFVKASVSQFKDIQSELGLENNCLATVLVLSLLETKFSSRKQELNFICIKGHMFLKSRIVNVTHVMKVLSKHLENIKIP